MAQREGGESQIGQAILDGMLTVSNAATLCPSTSKHVVVEILDIGNKQQSSESTPASETSDPMVSEASRSGSAGTPGGRHDDDPLMDALMMEA